MVSMYIYICTHTGHCNYGTHKAYDDHVDNLVKCLPLDDTQLNAMLSSQQLLPGDTADKIKSLSTPTDKASYFLNHVIKPALDIDETSEFEKLISIM